MPIFASVDSLPSGFSDDGGVVSVEVAEAELVLDVVATRVSNDVGTPVLYTIYDDAVSSISPDVGTICPSLIEVEPSILITTCSIVLPAAESAI
jgi:hypothetical protein